MQLSSYTYKDHGCFYHLVTDLLAIISPTHSGFDMGSALCGGFLESLSEVTKELVGACALAVPFEYVLIGPNGGRACFSRQPLTEIVEKYLSHLVPRSL